MSGPCTAQPTRRAATKFSMMVAMTSLTFRRTLSAAASPAQSAPATTPLASATTSGSGNGRRSGAIPAAAVAARAPIRS